MELGFDGLTVEGIAARAGVGKSTIYRRWPDAWSIVADAVLSDAARIAPVLERATARESFRASMRLVARSFRGRFGEILRPQIGRAVPHRWEPVGPTSPGLPAATTEIDPAE